MVWKEAKLKIVTFINKEIEVGVIEALFSGESTYLPCLPCFHCSVHSCAPAA